MVHLELPDEKMGFSDGKGEMFTVSSGGEILWSRGGRWSHDFFGYEDE